MATFFGSSRVPRRTRWAATGTAVLLSLTLGLGTQPAVADTASQPGIHHICADSLTLHVGGSTFDMNYAENRFDITKFDGNQVWGYELGMASDQRFLYGWVYNGWFGSHPC
jgi:hypothetical protein